MSALVFVIGNKAYSSCSLRPWLLMKHSGIAFDEVRISLYSDGAKQNLLRHSPSGRVPVLEDGDLLVWDSLAICEYLAEKYPEKQLWPADFKARAQARAISAEMHSGFGQLRAQMPMNVRREIPRRIVPAEVATDIGRIEAIWNTCRAQHEDRGPFLFGAFSIADAMFAPVVSRLRTYGVPVGGAAQQYAREMYALPAMHEWIEGARAETEINPQYET